MMKKENHVFEFRRNGVTMFAAKLYSIDETGKTVVYEDFIPSDEEIKSMAKDGYRAYLDGKLFSPGKTARPSGKLKGV